MDGIDLKQKIGNPHTQKKKDKENNKYPGKKKRHGWMLLNLENNKYPEKKRDMDGADDATPYLSENIHAVCKLFFFTRHSFPIQSVSSN